jgi:SAM-dependent methyltransferase
MSFLDLFSDNPELYASSRPGYPDALFQFIASNAPSTQSAWDCGTGNGQAAVSLARHFETVAASDPSPAQIKHAIPCKGVTYSVQPAESTTFPDTSFDAVCVAQALHWFELPAFFDEVKRVIKPQGIFAAWGYDWFGVSSAFDVTFERAILQVIEQDWAPQNALLWRGYRDIQIPFTRIETPELTIEVEWNLYQLLAYVYTWSATQRCMERMGNDFFTAAESALILDWGPPETEKNIHMKLYFIAGRFEN